MLLQSKRMDELPLSNGAWKAQLANLVSSAHKGYSVSANITEIFAGST
jgi:hypothetical protein